MCDENVKKNTAFKTKGAIISQIFAHDTTGEIKVANVHRAQQTDQVKALLKKK